MIEKINPEDVVGREAKHITYVRDQNGKLHDALFVKEWVHLKDGSKFPRLHMVEDFKRPFWITQKGRRTYRDRKDYAPMEHLQKYHTTQVELSRSIANILKEYSYGPNPPLKKLARSPYLFGVDVTTPCLLKAQYRKRFPDLNTPNVVAGGDVETDVVHNTNDIICMSVTCKEKACLVYLRRWIEDIPNIVEETQRVAEEHIGEVLKARGIKLEVLVRDTPGQVVQTCIGKLHEWKPDFLSFWNMDFDMGRMLEALEKDGVDPADVFSDPSIPQNYRYFDHRQGQAQKETASGKVISINIEDRWPWVTHPATFQLIDALPVYRGLRRAAGKDPSYKLDYILKKEGAGEKLKFDDVRHLTGLRWHQEMQRNHKVRYGVYNLYDTLDLELLDEKTEDLSRKITMFSTNSDYKNFNSNPKRLCDALHFWHLSKGEVIGASSDEPDHELDEHVVGTEDWIVTLPTYMAGPLGAQIVKELPGYNTIVHEHGADLDLVSAYPSASQLLNCGRDTCAMEFSKIKGISEHRRRELGVNLTGGSTNALEIMEKIHQMPPLNQILKEFCKANNYPIPEVVSEDDVEYIEPDTGFTVVDVESDVDDHVPSW